MSAITEAEATLKWCPMVRYAIGPEETALAAVNRNSALSPTLRQTEHARCIGSACMSWRWTHIVDPAWVQPRTGPAALMPGPTVQSDRGYCGLGGKP